jgi:hypothetical protein
MKTEGIMKTSKIKGWLLLVLLVIVGGVYYMSDMRKKIIPERQVEISQLWNDDYARQIANEAFDFDVAFILDEEKFFLLWQQANQGDKNALFYQLRAKFSIDGLFDDRGTSWEYDHRVFEYYQPEKRSVFNGFDATKHSFANIMLLADIGHPAASYFCVDRANYTYHWMEKLGNTRGARQDKLIDYLTHALNGGYHVQEKWAEYSLFSFDKAWRGVPLSEFDRKLSDREISERILKGYQVAAKNGSLPAVIRMSEAYFYGVGVAKNYEQAYIWSRIIDAVYPILLEEEMANREKDDEESENNLEVLNQVLKKSKELQEKIIPHVSTVQRIGSQKVTDELVSQMTFDYLVWLKLRDSVPPMP